MIALPEDFLAEAKVRLGGEYEEFVASYERSPYKGIRVNTLKVGCEEFINKNFLPLDLSPVEWEKNGFYVSGDKVGKTIFHAAGLYYSQEPSAMAAVPLLGVKRGERVLDMCSAPGGKGTQIASYMQGDGVLVLNEIDFSRAKILARNVERLGVRNAVVTCASPEKIASAFSGYFDKVLIDAPCSGEGMFLKEPNAIPQWSRANVAMCSVRQKKILREGASAVKCGGYLLYSTCTFSDEENELQIENFLKENVDFRLVEMHKLLPHKVKGEGHFVAFMQKLGGVAGSVSDFKFVPPAKKRLGLYREFEMEAGVAPFGNLHMNGDSLYSAPEDCPAFGDVQILRLGVPLGEFRGDRFEPSHSLAMCLRSDEVRRIDVDEKTATAYLRGMTFPCDEKLNGYFAVSYFGYNLGWCKCTSGTAKNHLPKALRI